MANYMSRLGIRQPNRDIVTGTSVMLEAAKGVDDSEISNNEETIDNEDTNTQETHVSQRDQERAKHYLKKNDMGIILYPQPHDNPNDPLNWPALRKDLCFFIIGLQTFIGGGQTAILAAGFSRLSVEFDKSISVISYLVGAFMLSLGLGSVFASPTAILYGKRLVYIVAIIIFLIGSIVCASSQTYGGLMAGRILTGFGASPTESLASASLSELYFQHERAYRTGLYTLVLLGGKNLLPLLSSLILQHLDRHWLYWIESMFLGLTLVLTFLFVPETYWDRSRPIVSATTCSRASYENKESPSSDTASRSSIRTSILQTTDTTGFVRSKVGIPSPKSFRHRLHIISGRHSEDRWWMVALRPIFLYSYPAVLYGSIVYSFAVVWLIVISEVLADIFQHGAYNYSAQVVGLFYISPFVGGILGSLAAGLLGDRVTNMVVKKNRGVYEPEFRLLMLFPSTLFSCIGLMGYGWSAHNNDLWIAPVVFFGCLSFGSSMASTTAISYTIDCYKMFAAEALVSFNFTKNIIGFVFSLFNNHAYDSLNGKRLFVIYGCVQLLVGLFGMLLYIYGKMLRAWTDDQSLLKHLYHADHMVSETEKGKS